ncbi:hypothetical protein SEA_CULVER_168 [Gordonia phage Culver]|nr:hypothetical protein SEA_CULVER_168 [Gordonia phage Culver]
MPHDMTVGDEVCEDGGWRRGRVVHVDWSGDVTIDWYPTTYPAHTADDDLIVTTEA